MPKSPKKNENSIVRFEQNELHEQIQHPTATTYRVQKST